MQHAGHQYGQGAVPISGSTSVGFEPPEQQSPGGGSITSSLRQWRKKDALERQQQTQNHNQQPPPPAEQPSAPVPPVESSTHVARVAPQTHFPRNPGDIYRLPPHYSDYGLAYKDSPAQVRYSEIVENSVPNIPPILEPKEKEYMKMCTVQQQPHIKQYSEQLKQGYPDAMKQAYDPNLQQYVPKEPPLPPYPQKESHLHPYQQYYSKYNFHGPRNYPSQPETNNFLATLNQINPRMAQSIMNDHHIRESQMGMYPNVDQTRNYQQRLYHPQAQMRTSPTYPAPAHRGVPQTYNYPQQYSYKPQDAYNGMPQYQLPPKYENYKMNPHMEPSPRSISPPRRGYHENMAMPPTNYAPVPQKVSPTYSQCAQLEYSRHYQHRRMPVAPEYYQQGYKPPYMQTHQMPSENHENSSVVSNSIKQFLENWVEEEVNGALPDIVMSSNGTDPEKIQLVKGPIRIKEDGTQEQYYVLGTTEIPHDNLSQYVHVPQVEKLPENITGFYENSLPVTEAPRIIIKGPEAESVASNVEIIASGSVNGTDRINIIENRRIVPGHADKEVNLHIVEAEGEDLTRTSKDARACSSGVAIPQEEGNWMFRSEVFSQEQKTSAASLPVLSDTNNGVHQEVPEAVQEVLKGKEQVEEQRLDTQPKAEISLNTVTSEPEINIGSGSVNAVSDSKLQNSSVVVDDGTGESIVIKNNDSEHKISKITVSEEQPEKEVIGSSEASVVEEHREENLSVPEVMHPNTDTSDSVTTKEDVEENQSEQPSTNIHSEINNVGIICDTSNISSNNNDNSDTKDATNNCTKTDEFYSLSENKHSEIPTAGSVIIPEEKLPSTTENCISKTIQDDTLHSYNENIEHIEHKSQNRAEVPVIVSPKLSENSDAQFSKAQERDQEEIHTIQKKEEDLIQADNCALKENRKIQEITEENSIVDINFITEILDKKDEDVEETANTEKPINHIELDDSAKEMDGLDESNSYTSADRENEKTQSAKDMSECEESISYASVGQEKEMRQSAKEHEESISRDYVGQENGKCHSANNVDEREDTISHTSIGQENKMCQSAKDVDEHEESISHDSIGEENEMCHSAKDVDEREESISISQENEMCHSAKDVDEQGERISHAYIGQETEMCHSAKDVGERKENISCTSVGEENERCQSAKVVDEHEESISYASVAQEKEMCQSAKDVDEHEENINDASVGQKNELLTKEVAEEAVEEKHEDLKIDQTIETTTKAVDDGAPEASEEKSQDVGQGDETITCEDTLENELDPKVAKQEADIENGNQNEEQEENEVLYRSALKIDNNNVLLQIDDELVEITVKKINGKKVITVIPFTGATVVDHYNDEDIKTDIDELDIPNASDIDESNVDEVDQLLEEDSFKQVREIEQNVEETSVEQLQEIEHHVEEIVEENEAIKNESVLEDCGLLVLDHNEVVVECEEIKDEAEENTEREKNGVLTTTDTTETEEAQLPHEEEKEEELLPPILERMDLPVPDQSKDIDNHNELVLPQIEQQQKFPKFLTKASRKHFSDVHLNVEYKQKKTVAQIISRDLKYAKRTNNTQNCVFKDNLKKNAETEKAFLTKPKASIDVSSKKLQEKLPVKLTNLKMKKLQQKKEDEEGKDTKRHRPLKKVRFEENGNILKPCLKKIRETKDGSIVSKDTKVEEKVSNLNLVVKNIKENKGKTVTRKETNGDGAKLEKTLNNLNYGVKKVKETKDKKIISNETKFKDKKVEVDECNLNSGITKIKEIKDKKVVSNETKVEDTKVEEKECNLNSGVKKFKETKDNKIVSNETKVEDKKMHENQSNLNSGGKKIKDIKDKTVTRKDVKMEDQKVTNMDKHTKQNNGIGKSVDDLKRTEKSEKQTELLQNEPVSVPELNLFEDEKLEPKRNSFNENRSIYERISTPKQSSSTSQENPPSKFTPFDGNSSITRPIEHRTYENSQKRRLSLQEYNRRKKRMHQSPVQPKSSSASTHHVPSTESQESSQKKSAKVETPKCYEKRAIDLPKTPSYRSTIIDADEFDIPTKTEEDDLNDIRTSHSFTFPMGNTDVKQVKDEIDKKLNSIELQIPKTSKTNQLPQKVTLENDLLMRRFLNRENLTPEEVQKVKEIINCKRVLEEINKAKMLKQVTKDNMDYKRLNHNLKTSESDAKRGVYEVKRHASVSKTVEHLDVNRNLKLHLKKVPQTASNPRKRRRFRNLYTEQSSESDGSTETTANDGESAEDNSEHNYRVYQSKVKNGLPTIIIKRKLSAAMQPYVKLERSACIDMLAKRRKVF